MNNKFIYSYARQQGKTMMMENRIKLNKTLKEKGMTYSDYLRDIIKREGLEHKYLKKVIMVGH